MVGVKLGKRELWWQVVAGGRMTMTMTMAMTMAIRITKRRGSGVGIL
jgi:hypothetical protein